MVTRATDDLSASDRETSNNSAPLETAPALTEYVRKIEAAEILVRDWRTESTGSTRSTRSAEPTESHVVSLRWPHTHPFHTLYGGVTSPLLFTEGIRQALAVLSHTVHRIPLDHRLGWEYVRFSVEPAAFVPAEGRPDTIDMRIRHTDVVRRRRGSVRVTAQIEASGAGAPVGRAELRYITHPPEIYDTLREDHADARRAFARALPPAPGVTARQVGRTRARDVVLAPAAGDHQWRLRTDTTHEVLFDHPHDHVPGMVLLEAAAQAAHAEALPGRVFPVAFETAFSRYVELDEPCLIVARPAGPDALGRPRLKVDGIQNGKVASSTLVTTEPRTGEDTADTAD